MAAEDVAGWDLMAHDVQPPAYLGRDRELLAAGRAWTTCFRARRHGRARRRRRRRRGPAVHPGAGRLRPRGERQRVRHRRRRPAARQRPGALRVRPRRQATRTGPRIAGTVCVSSDTGHAVHPNYAERHDPTHHPMPNGGPILKVNVNQRYATDGTGRGVFAAACERAGVPFQTFVSNNAMPCGTPSARSPPPGTASRPWTSACRSCRCTPPANCAAPTTRSCWPSALTAFLEG